MTWCSLRRTNSNSANIWLYSLRGRLSSILLPIGLPSPSAGDLEETERCGFAINGSLNSECCLIEQGTVAQRARRKDARRDPYILFLLRASGKLFGESRVYLNS